MTGQNFLLSVIVPVYNTAPYLRKCLDSIIHQTYQNLEVILVVDSGSSDNSAEICEEYAAMDSRVKILRRPHEGLVSARKAAVSAASGDYIAYVDSDDWLELDGYERLLTSMGNLVPDVLLYGYQSEYKEKTIVCQYTVPVGYFNETGIKEEIYPRLLRARHTYQWEFSHTGNSMESSVSQGQIQPNLQSDILECVWSKLVKRELLQETQMMVPDRVSIGEDVVCGVYTLFSAHSIMVTGIAPYHYLMRNTSASHGGISIDQHREMFSALYTAVSNRPLADVYISRLYELMLRNLLTSCYEVFLGNDVSDVLFGNLNGCRVALYGAGRCGQEIYRQTSEIFPDQIVLWVDKQYKKFQKENLPVEPVEELLHQEYDVAIIALVDEETCKDIKCNLIDMGIPAEKIRYPSATPEVLQTVKKIMQCG